MLVVLNESARAGKAGKRWKRYGDSILKRAGIDLKETEILIGGIDLEHNLDEAVRHGEKEMISAGGDGTFNRLITFILDRGEMIENDVTVGAIGLGSSNDLHKPYSKSSTYKGIPYMLDFSGSRLSNIIRLSLTEPGGRTLVRYSAVNSSIGVIAEGNDIFNRGRGFTGLMKKTNRSLGIYSSAISSMFRNRPVDCRIEIDGDPREMSISGISILLNPHFTGGLKYDTPVDRYQDHFLVNLGERMSIPGSIASFVSISRGKFKGRRKCHSWKADRMSVDMDREVPVEFDGEVITAGRVEFELMRRCLRICG